MRRILPSSGFGPSGSRLEEWSWQVAVDARTAGGHHVRVDVDADGHPGYLTTAKLLGEVGLLLGEDGATPRAGRLPDAGDRARHRQPRSLRARRRPLRRLLLRSALASARASPAVAARARAVAAGCGATPPRSAAGPPCGRRGRTPCGRGAAARCRPPARSGRAR